MPGIQEGWLTGCTSELVASDWVATEDTIDLAHLAWCDLSELSSQLKRVDFAISILPFRYVFPSGQGRLLEFAKVLAGTHGVNLEKLAVLADSSGPRLQERWLFT